MSTITINEDYGPSRGESVLPISRERLHRRTRELAQLAGRGPAGVLQADYEQARCDLTGERDRERQEAKLEPILDDENEEADGSEGSDVGLVERRG